MITFDFTSYIPAVADIPSDRIAEARAKIDAILLDMWPDLDTRPTSFYGDNLVSQLAIVEAARAIAAERLRSDMDTEALAAGVVYNCDVARAFLANYAMFAQEEVKARGLVRLVFNRSRFMTDAGVEEDGYLTINRGLQFLFGSTDVFKLSLAFDDDDSFRVFRPGLKASLTGKNQFCGQEDVSGNIVVDVPVLGTMTTPIVDGTAAQIDSTVTALSAVTARSDFSTGFPAADIKSLAARARLTAYAASLSSKGGAVASVLRDFPTATVVSAVTNGDPELTRGTDQSLFLFQRPCLDVYVRSDTILTDTLVVRLRVYSSGENHRAAGAVTFAHVPIALGDLKFVDNQGIYVASGNTISSGNARSTLVSHAGPALAGPVTRTYDEQFYMVLDISDDDLTSVIRSDDGDYVLLSIVYTYDPILAQVRSVVEAPRNSPVDVDVRVRSFFPLNISLLTVNYTRTPGVTVNIGLAASEILTSVNGVGWPDRFTRTHINDSLLYSRARGVSDLRAAGTLVVSVADRLRDTTDTMSVSTYSDLETVIDDDSVSIADFEISQEASLNPSSIAVPNPDYDSYADWAALNQTRGYGIGPRNIRWILSADALSFKEVTT